MATRTVNFDFFHLHSRFVDQFESKLRADIDNIAKGQLNNVKVFDYVARIRDFNDDNDVLVLNVEKLNLLDEAYIGDLSGARQTLATEEDQGPLIDTVFLFDPLAKVIVLQRNRSGLTMAGFTKFLAGYLNDDDLELEIVLDETTYHKFEKMNVVQEIEYSVAKPNPKFLKDNERSLDGDLRLMDKLHGSSMTVKIGAPKKEPLFLEAAKNKVKEMLRRPEDSYLNPKLRIKGTIDGEVDTLDLIKKRMVYPKKFNLTKGRKLTPYLVMDGVWDAYKHHRDALIGMFVKENF